ncbi:MAG TPA: DUF1223 domain-containing protein [Bradyrhizobium sp.]|jgi:hypothetical protein|uniref:DUF1223 domain-containing protein n=1 Tax=Bradyrhizobium sp. TaxID=376 RepID=UPI002C0C4105|nr:DUF1223 domain-containing protein [Bradyrhizobium sp.]HXB79041.1 DUF1223 domain-containing protein [Bradyrhizobium sp.]
MLSRLVLSLVLIAGFSPAASLAAERPVVVELFTSQGCNSCPPANAFLNEMSKQRRDVLALAFHVTYWDRLGWKDPFSMEAATRRQDVYGRRFGDGSYTPEMVVDGAASMVGSARGEVNSAIENAKRNSRTAAPVSVTKNGEQVSIEVGAGSGSGNILLIGFDHEHTTAVGRGENSGRTLVEANVVRSIRSVGQWSGTAMRISERFPEGQDVAVVLEAPDGRIIGASRLNGSGST